MKKNEVALLILVVALCMGIGYVIGQSVLGNKVNKPVQVEYVDPISAKVVPPDQGIFKDDAINPTVPVNIGNTIRQDPFTE